MLFVLAGPSTVGKSYCVEYLCGAFDFKTFTPYTTRAPRISESEGFHYHFRSAPELRQLTNNLSVGYWARPLDDGNVYGYTREVESLVAYPTNWVIQAYTDIALALKAKERDSVLVFLDFADDDALEERILQRYGSAGEDVIARRRAHAEHERSFKKQFDYILTSNSPEDIVRQLLQIVLTRSKTLPQRSPVLPGPLSDVDILASLEAPDGLRIEGISADQITTRVSGWSVDLTLAPRYYRVVYPILFRRVFDLARGSSADMLKRFRECVTPEGAGIYLKPQEFVLASTMERVTIPARMVCILSGRSSYARMGVQVDLSQIILQPGHDDLIPLEIKNNMPFPIVLYPGVSIAQAVFFNTISSSASPYNSRSRAKYPPHTNDVRSRYYLDPAYARIREMLPPQRVFDWDHLLNVLLLIVGWLTAASWFVGRIPDPRLAATSTTLAVVFFGITTLTILVRLVRFFIRRP